MAHFNADGQLTRQSKHGRLVFPLEDGNGDLINLYGRAIWEDEKEDRHDILPGRRGLFDARSTGQCPALFVCEGPFDALSLSQVGFDGAVALCGLSGLDLSTKLPRQIILCLDGDQRGRDASTELVTPLTMMGKEVWSIDTEDLHGSKDLNELLCDTGDINLGPELERLRSGEPAGDHAASVRDQLCSSNNDMLGHVDTLFLGAAVVAAVDHEQRGWWQSANTNGLETLAMCMVGMDANHSPRLGFKYIHRQVRAAIPAGLLEDGLEPSPNDNYLEPPYPSQEIPEALLEMIPRARLISYGPPPLIKAAWQQAGFPEPREWIWAEDHFAARFLTSNDIEQVMYLPLQQRASAPTLDALWRASEACTGLCNRWQKQAMHDKVHADETRVMELSHTINESGIPIDTDFALALMSCHNSLAEALFALAEQQSNSEITRALIEDNRKLNLWLASHGIENVDKLDQKTVKELMRCTSLPDEVRSGLDTIYAIRWPQDGILRKMLLHTSGDKRLRWSYKYHGAHTGRWSSTTLPIMGLPKVPPEVDVDEAIAAVAKGDITALAQLSPMPTAALLGKLVRLIIAPPQGQLLCRIDFRQIEARVLAWIAGEEWLLEAFRGGEDVYLTMARRMFGDRIDDGDPKWRKLGKQAVLGLGFGMGADTLAENLSEIGVEVDPKELLEAYRTSVPNIAGKSPGKRGYQPSSATGGVWQTLPEAAINAVKNDQRQETCMCSFDFEEPDLVVTLPSGREKVYTNVQVKSGAKTVVYRPINSDDTIELYGGRLTENIVQAVARDILAHTLEVTMAEGAEVSMICHDEIVFIIDDPSKAEGLLRHCTTPPLWVQDLPLDAEVQIMSRYGAVV